MKVAELFAELGFKVEGAEELRAFETSLNNIAQAARNAALAMRILSRTHVPASVVRAFSKPSVAPGAVPAVAPNAPTVVVAATPPGVIPPAAGPSTPTAVTQGFKSLTTFAKQLIGFGSLAYLLKALITNISRMTMNSIGAAFSLSRLTQQTNLSREELKRWELAAAKADVSQQEIQDQLGKLAQQASEIPWGKHLEAASAGAFLGINMLAKPTEILRQFGERMQGKTFAQARMFGEQLGISPNVAFMMQQNKGVIPALPSGQALSDSEQQARERAAVALQRLSVAASALADRFTAWASGPLGYAFGKLADFVRGYNLLLDSRGRPADWPLPRMTTAPVVHQTTVGGANVEVNINESNNPQRSAQIIQRVLSSAQYQRPPTWPGPVPAAQ